MKKFTIVIATALALSLTACSEGEEKLLSELSENNSPESRPNSEETSRSSAPLPFTLFGADNVQINFGDVTSIIDRNGEPLSPEKLEDTAWKEISCEGFAFLAERPNTVLNSADNADLFDEKTGLFTNVPSYSKIEYKRFYVGGKIGSLTITSAKTLFSREGFNDKSGPLTSEQIKAEGMPFSAMLKRCDVSFDGELTMTGYVRVNVDEYGVDDGEVLFAPSGNCPLPVVNFYAERDTDHVVTPLWTQNTHGFSYVSEYPMIRLGNIHENADLSGFPTDGTSVKVKVTVTDITMFSDTDMASFIDCRIVDIDRI